MCWYYNFLEESCITVVSFKEKIGFKTQAKLKWTLPSGNLIDLGDVNPLEDTVFLFWGSLIFVEAYLLRNFVHTRARTHTTFILTSGYRWTLAGPT